MIGWLAMGVGVAQAIGLDEVRERAVDGALAVQRERARTDRASGAWLQALAGNLPQIGANAQASASSGPNPIGQVTVTQLQVGVSGSWALLDPAQWTAAAAARRSLRGQQALVTWAESTARRDATVAYASALAAEETLAARIEAATDARRAAEGVGSLVEAGLRPTADGARALAVAESLEADRQSAAGDVAGTCAALQSLIGEEITGHCELDPVQTWHTPGEAVPVHPALVAADQAARAARAARRGTVWSAAPAISGTVDASQGVGTATVGDSEIDLSGVSLSAGVRADLPLIGSGLRIGQVREATGARDEAAVALEEQRRLLQVGRITAEARYSSAQATVQARSRALSAAEEALRLVSARYEQGLEDLEPWLSARRDRDDARVAMAQARGALGIALAELEAVRGVR